MDGFNDVKKIFEEMDQHLKQELKDRLEKRSPIDTGDLRRSYSITDEGIVSCEELGKVYALEYGHSSQAPNGFIRITTNEAGEIINEYLRDKGR